MPDFEAGYQCVTHPFATSSYSYCYKQELVRLACLRRAANVRPEPGSNSQMNSPEVRREANEGGIRIDLGQCCCDHSLIVEGWLVVCSLWFVEFLPRIHALTPSRPYALVKVTKSRRNRDSFVLCDAAFSDRIAPQPYEVLEG